ncbi:MAG: formylglycine-generating enzyme family protein [Treponema sp.]|nr:formylglycine-generating enzyme family protein [Treponema sp.]
MKIINCFLIINVLVSCNNPIDSPLRTPSGAKFGIVNINIAENGTSGNDRTIKANPPEFSSYRLVFTSLQNNFVKEDIIFSAEENSAKDIALQEGTWKITAFGRVFFMNSEIEFAQGSITANVINGKNINIVIYISNITNEGEGLFSWRFNLEDQLLATSYSIVLSEYGDQSKKILNIENPIDNNESIIIGEAACKSGYYLLQVKIGTDRQMANIFEVVHIDPYLNTAFERNVKQSDFVPIVILSGDVDINIAINGTVYPSAVLQSSEVFVRTSSGSYIGSGMIKDHLWIVRIAKQSEIRTVNFSVLLSVLGSEIELFSDVYKNVLNEDIDNIHLKFNESLISLEGSFLSFTSNSVPVSGWKINGYTDPSDPEESAIALNATMTGISGQWLMIIRAFSEPTTVWFSVEKYHQEKLHRRDKLHAIELFNNRITSIPITANFMPPNLVKIYGNISKDTDSLNMTAQLNNGCHTITLVGLESFTQYYFKMTGTWDGLNEAEYNFLNVIHGGSIDCYEFDNAISWFIGIHNEKRPINQENFRITLDFRDDEYLSSGRPSVKVNKCEELFIPKGQFNMGSPSTELGNKGPDGLTGKSGEVLHTVIFTNDLFAMPYPVTQAEYKELMPEPLYKDNKFKSGRFPVVYISWFDALDYCNLLSDKDGFDQVYTINGTGSARNVTVDWMASGWRLPTESEWEYLCRAGTTTPFSLLPGGDGTTLSTSMANYNGSVIDTNFGYNPVPGISRGCLVDVDEFSPNPWGLYQMHGNAWEMTGDWYGDYPSGPQTDPRGPVSGTSEILGTDAAAKASMNQRVIRGGSFCCPARYLRSGHRGAINPMDDSYEDIGFRMVRIGK